MEDGRLEKQSRGSPPPPPVPPWAADQEDARAKAKLVPIAASVQPPDEELQEEARDRRELGATLCAEERDNRIRVWRAQWEARLKADRETKEATAAEKQLNMEVVASLSSPEQV